MTPTRLASIRFAILRALRDSSGFLTPEPALLSAVSADVPGLSGAEHAEAIQGLQRDHFIAGSPNPVTFVPRWQLTARGTLALQEAEGRA
jgi:hypothetical protein